MSKGDFIAQTALQYITGSLSVIISVRRRLGPANANNYSQKTAITHKFFRILIQLSQEKMKQKHTTAGIRWWSPTQLLTCRRVA